MERCSFCEVIKLDQLQYTLFFTMRKPLLAKVEFYHQECLQDVIKLLTFQLVTELFVCILQYVQIAVEAFL